MNSISFEKRWPDRLSIKVSVRKPLAIVEDKNQALFLVDQEGLLFRSAAGEPLPVIKLGEDFEGKIGLRLPVDERGIASYLKTLDLVSAKGLETQAIYLRSQTIELQLTGTVVWFNTEWSIEEQLELLTQILQRLKLGGSTPQSIDLRFSRPVVKL
uniref:POTRA domain-containing protein n=1 Tax=candidate division WWE3 bacterium TaxID=2053526 RepID=A0A831YPY8_UNCKA